MGEDGKADDQQQRKRFGDQHDSIAIERRVENQKECRDVRQ